jgi:hypothetical protein
MLVSTLDPMTLRPYLLTGLPLALIIQLLFMKGWGGCSPASENIITIRCHSNLALQHQTPCHPVQEALFQVGFIKR